VEYSAWALLYLLVRGRVRIAGGRSGRTMQRNTRLERGVHWFTAALFIILLRDSLFNRKLDLDRSMEAGGYLGGSHSGSEKFNVGQKLWYWVAVLAGVVLGVSGLLLDFPNFGQGRELLQLSHLFHAIAGVIILAFFIVHLYAAIGIEGTLEAMVSGKVDANWARQHHDLCMRSRIGPTAVGKP